jgi:hypothetical protein
MSTNSDYNQVAILTGMRIGIGLGITEAELGRKSRGR